MRVNHENKTPDKTPSKPTNLRWHWSLGSKPAPPQTSLMVDTLLAAHHDFRWSLGISNEDSKPTGAVRAWATGLGREAWQKGRFRSWATERDVFTCPVHKFLTRQLYFVHGVSALSLPLTACLKVLWRDPSRMKPSGPLAGDKSWQAGVNMPSRHTYLGEPLYVLGQRAHSPPLVMLEQLEDGGIHCIIWWDSPKEVRVFLLIS